MKSLPYCMMQTYIHTFFNRSFTCACVTSSQNIGVGFGMYSMSAYKCKHPKNRHIKEVSTRQNEITKRISELGSRNNEFGKAQFPYCTKRLLFGFASFIDEPHGYNNQLHDLDYCQSTIYGLQQRQRERV
ncbi:hypothetical protein Q8W14_08955 [Photobacterium damselae subsp. piscicida]|nr:hypothetical protein [Photobacterium damselae subsp. piscicida]